MGSMKLKAKVKNNICHAKLMIKHEMLTYSQAKKRGKKANFLTSIEAKVNGQIVYRLLSSQFLAKNPLFKFRFYAKRGDVLEVTWVDLLGYSDTRFITIR
jgi:hypothetical protein